MKNCPLLSIVIQLFCESLSDDDMSAAFDDIWNSLTNDGLRSTTQHFDHILEDGMKSLLEEPSEEEVHSSLFMALREYYRDELFQILKDSNVLDRANLYKLVLETCCICRAHIDGSSKTVAVEDRNMIFLTKNVMIREGSRCCREHLEDGSLILDAINVVKPHKIESTLFKTGDVQLLINNHTTTIARELMGGRNDTLVPVIDGTYIYIQVNEKKLQRESCFEAIKQYHSNDTNKEDIFETARMLLSRLQEVSELKTKYLCVFSCISNQKIFDEWQKELSRYLVELSDKMENLSVTQKIEALNTKLLIVKALSRLDGFLEGENDVYKKVIDDIKNTDYVQVASGMVALQSSNEVGKHFHEQAKRAPGVGLDKDAFNQIEALKERQNDVVLKVVKKYSEMDITGYTLNSPKDIFEKFGKVNNANEIYNEAVTTIRDRIIEKFRKELEQAKLKKPPNPENLHIRKFESAVKYLPEDMRSAVELELKYCKDDINRDIDDFSTQLDNAVSGGDLKEMKKVMQDIQLEGMSSIAQKGRELVQKQVQEIMVKINQNFEQDEIREALANAKQLYDYKIELENVVVEIRQLYLEIRRQLRKTFEDAYVITELTPYSNMLELVSYKTEELKNELIKKELINGDILKTKAPETVRLLPDIPWHIIYLEIWLKVLRYDDAYALLREADPTNAINTLPMCPDSGTLWLFSDNDDSKQAKAYVYDGYQMHLDKRRTDPPMSHILNMNDILLIQKTRNETIDLRKLFFSYIKDCTVVEETLMVTHI
ncbi:unnamed protein product [Didymodactylos carnosus]|uniref:Uncharacterized protein n=1 Tax=Didymodactylos carnosus TaxID=1234261 RepID=A0A814SEY5_9BILA|nr:unnamed protein product [Didymodactylos carnosus]CAF3909166.1 unnamed protein product [Didymodactylos carnosus]